MVTYLTLLKCFLILFQYGKKNIYNTTGKDYLSIFELTKNISNNLNGIEVILPKNSSKLKHIGSDVDQVIISSERYIKEFNKNNFVPFEDGIRNVVNWNLGNLKQ